MVNTSVHQSPPTSSRRLIVGVDTHKAAHVAVAVSALGERLGAATVPATQAGYGALFEWARSLGNVDAFAVEGTGSYGAGLASFLRRHDARVVEVSHVDRRKRRRDGKDDTLDAEQAARACLARTGTSVPKTADGVAETLRQLKIARDTAVKARSSAMIALKSVLVTAPATLRERLEPLTDRALLAQCRDLDASAAGEVSPTPANTASYVLRTLAIRWCALADEVAAHDAMLDALTAAAAPMLRGAFGIGPDGAAEMLIVAGDNPGRIRSEGAFAKLCGACPIPASSGVTHRHRLNRGGHRQANAALYRIVIVRLRWHAPTLAYVARRTAEGLSKKDIIRCLKRFVAREVYRALLSDHAARTANRGILPAAA